MCGIAGWVTREHAAPEAAVLKAMLTAIAHRGPDDEGAWFASATASGEAVALGHRRLAIIAPEGARQPMVDAAAGIVLSFNGEIYNFRELRATLAALGHRFDLDSDTEVVLRAYQQWGTGMFAQLRGMFALAVWDGGRQRLVLARDRFGEKPLFLHEDGRGLFFASEPKALRRVPGVGEAVDLRSVRDYLCYRYVPGPKTLLRNVHKLLPGCFAVWQGGKLSVSRYYSLPDRETRVACRAPGDPVAAFRQHMEAAVAEQMVSDVPFGAFLSGGLDSSVIVGLMARNSVLPVKTFSVGFAERAYSELEHAAVVARAFKTEHSELVVDASDVIEHLPSLVRFRDAPVAEPSDVPIYLLAREASRSVKMVLTGEGSDEILAGYPKHVAERFVPLYQKLPGPLRGGVIEPLAAGLPYRFRRAKITLANFALERRSERYVRWFGALSERERDELFCPSADQGHPIDPPGFDSPPDNSPLRRILYFDQAVWLPDNLLERGDRMTMAASIEARVPFLDHRLAAFVSTLPDRWRLRGVRTKWILREAARSLVPRQILERPKVGFRVPVNSWFRGPLREFLCDHLQGGQSRTRAYFDAGRLDGILADHLDGRHNHEKLLWSLLTLEIWHRECA